MKQKRMISFILAVGFLFSLLTFPAQAEDKPEWTYKFTLWVADVNDAGAPEASVYGYLLFRDNSKREQSFAKAGIKRNATVTKELNSTYAPWTIKKIGIANKSDDALCVEGIKLEVKEKNQGDGSFKTLLDKYNPKSDNKKWIETQKGSGYDTDFGKDVSRKTKREISAIGDFANVFAGEYKLDVTKSYTNTVKKTWNKRITDQYLTNYNARNYSDVPTISYAVSATALDTNLTIDSKRLAANGFSASDTDDGYSLDMAKILAFMNKQTINKLTITSTLKIPTASLDTDDAAYKNLGGKSDGKFTSAYTITRNAFAVSDITYKEAVSGPENIRDNYYYGNANPTVKVAISVKTGGNNNHITNKDIKGKKISFKSAKIQLGNDANALVSASATTVTIDNNGTFTLAFPLRTGLDSENVGVTLLLEGGKIDAKDGLWLCEEKQSFEPGKLSQLASAYKVDTIAPVITLTPTGGIEENGWRKSITLTSTASENVYSGAEANVYKYALKSADSVYSITGKNGIGDYNVVQTAPAAGGYATDVTIALRDALEAIGDLVITGTDIAGNPVATTYKDIKLDTLAPRVALQANEKARATDGSKSTEYAFDIQDASGTGRVYYCFTDGSAPVFDENNLLQNSGTLDTTLGKWAYIEQGTKAVALLKCANGQSFSGTLHYFTKDAFDNTSQTLTHEVTLLNENTSCDITATNANTNLPLKAYDISVTTAQGNKIFWRWSYPGKEGYIANFRSYSSDIGKGTQTDDNGNAVVLDGECTLEVKIVTPSNAENIVSRKFVFDNSAPEIDFTARSAGTFRAVQTIGVKATDASQITAATAVVLRADGTAVTGIQEIPVNIADGIAAQDISPAGLANGTYFLKVTATDGNGFVAEKRSNPFYIRSGAPDLTLTVPSDKTYGEAPLLSQEDYTLRLQTSEVFADATDYPMQTLYYRVADSNGEYSAWVSAGAMSITENGYALATELATPMRLSEGENLLSVQTGITVGGASPDYLGADSIATKSITVYYDETAPQYRLLLQDVHTSREITGTVVLSDNLSGEMTLTASDAKVRISKTEDENTFAITVTDNTDTVLTAVDRAGNVTEIPVTITMIDKTAPTAVITEVAATAKGARVDASAKISITGADRDTVQFALIPVAEATANSIDEKYFSFDMDAFKYTLLSKQDGAYADEADSVYQVSLAGVTGDYVIGVRCSDSVGNTSDTIFRDNPLQPIDARISAGGFTVSPKNAGEKAVVTATFNVPVSALPQNMITTVAAEGATLEETNLELASNYIEGFSQKVSFLIEETGTYKLYTVDELGRKQAVDIRVTDADVTFGTTRQLEVNLFRLKKRYGTVLAKTPIAVGSWASSEMGYAEDGELYTIVEIAAKESDIVLRDAADPAQPTVDGLTFNAAASTRVPDTDDYTTLVYDVSQILNEEGKAVDQNERIIEVYAYRADEPSATWQKIPVVIDTIDNTPPSGELILDPPVLRDAGTGDPLSFTLGNVKAQATFSDPHSGIDTIGFSIWNGAGQGTNYEVQLTEDYSTEPYRLTNAYFSMTVWSDTNPKGTKLVELEIYDNMGATLYAVNGADTFGDCGAVDGLNINYINKVDISDADYTLSYYYMDQSGAWQPITGEATYYKNAKAVLAPTEQGTARGLYTANSNGTKLLNAFDHSFDFIVKDKYGYEKTVSATLSHFDETVGTVTYELKTDKKTNAPVEIKITARDDESGVGTVTLMRGTEEIPLTDRGGGVFLGEVANVGAHVITLLDKVGNKTQKSFMVSNIDSTLPVITERTYSTEARTSKTVSVQLQYSKPNVTLTKVETDGILQETDYSVDYTNSTLRFSENGTLSVWFTDDYGNENSNTVEVHNIYKLPPAVEAVATVADDKLSVNVRFQKATDNLGVPIDKKRALTELTVMYGGIAKRIVETVTVDDAGNPLSEPPEVLAEYVFSENGIYTFKVYDDEGLASYVTIEVTGIDTAAPKITQIRWNYDYSVLDNGVRSKKTESGMRTVGNEAGYIMATDIYPVTNQDVSITAVTDSDTTIVGTDGDFAKEHTLKYAQNGMYTFNLEKANGLSASYSVDVELIDKTPPVIEVDSPEIVFYENPAANAVPYTKALLETVKAYDMFGGYTDISDRVTIEYGNFHADDITQNVFDRTAPYTITYRVSDDAGNTTELTRTVRLVGYFDTIALVNNTLPDYAGRKEINTDTINISLKNFSGISYARIAKGVKTLGQMKKTGDVIQGKTLGGGEYECTVTENGWYTVMVQTDKRDYFNLQIYVQK